jgi:hypothetical protein
VRIAYQNKPDPTSHDSGIHRFVAVELVSYPQWLGLLTNAVNQDPTIPYTAESTQDFLSAIHGAWGDARSEESTLPRELAGLQLGETFLKAIAARPDLKNTTRDVGNAHDVRVASVDQGTIVTIRNGKVAEICEDKRIPGNHFEEYRSKLPNEYGNPRYAQRNQQRQVVGLSWWNQYQGLAMDVGFLSGDDNPSQFSHLLSREYLVDTTRPPENVVVNTCIKDVSLAQEPFIAGTPDPLVPFRSAPQRKSFF